MNRYDVIISGAGPVGLFLACELAMKNCSVLILEKTQSGESPLKKLPFGIRGLSAPSIEALYRRNLLNNFEIHKQLKSPHMNAGAGSQRQVGHFAGIPILEGNVDSSQWKNRLPSSTETSLITSMEEIEKILNQRALDLGVIVRRGVEVTRFQQSSESITVYADETFEAKFLVGCDGARSIVRKLGNFEFAGTEPEFTGYSTKIELADAEKLKSGRIVTSKGMYLQSQPGFVVIQDFDGGAYHDSRQTITLQHVQEVLRKVSETDVTVTTLHYATTWTDRARQATKYRNGRIFLAGDAAHIHSPLGGQGLNLGLGDAMNLGWKLAAVIHSISPEELLDTYENERHPIGEQVLDWSRAQVAIMRPTPEARALNAIVRDFLNTKDGTTYVAGRVWGIHTHYNLRGDHPLVGHSVPNFEFEDGTKIGEYMRDGEWILLDLKKHDELKFLVADRAKYITGKAKEDFGLSALLIRPDGIVVWVDQQLTLQAVLTSFSF